MKEIFKDWFPPMIAHELGLYVAKLPDKTLVLKSIKLNHKLVIAHNIVDNDDNEFVFDI